MFEAHGLSSSQAAAVKEFEAHLGLGTFQTWDSFPSQVPPRSGHSSFIRSRFVHPQDLRPGTNWALPQLVSFANLTSVDGSLHISLSEVEHAHIFGEDLPLRTWLIQASDSLLEAQYSFVWYERGLQGPPPSRRAFVFSQSCPNLSQLNDQQPLFDWGGDSAQHTQALDMIDHSNFDMF
jgi:hypothetical protein